jgi:hypothetical protein
MQSDVAKPAIKLAASVNGSLGHAEGYGSRYKFDEMRRQVLDVQFQFVLSREEGQLTNSET